MYSDWKTASGSNSSSSVDVSQQGSAASVGGNAIMILLFTYVGGAVFDSVEFL